MNILRIAILCSLIILQSPSANAAKLVTKLRVSLDTYSIRASDDATPTRAIFVGAPVRGEIALVAAALPAGGDSAASMPLPSAQWWQHLVWSV